MPQIVGKTSEGRPIVLNDDGTVSTERTITISDPGINGGKFTNIPTMFGGKQVSEPMAIIRIRQSKGVDPETGQSLKGFSGADQAVQAAQLRSNQLGKKLRPILKKLGIEF